MRYAYSVTTALLLGGAALSLSTGFPAGAQVAQNDSSVMAPRAGTPGSFADLTEQLQPAVVNISTRQRVEIQSQNPFQGTPFENLFGNGQNGPITRDAESLGSGFLVSANGYVVTNNHVVNPPDQRAKLQEVTVTLSDGTDYLAELIGTDPQSDLAVLKIARREPFPYVKFGDSNEARVGDWVIAIGNPFGLGGTVTSGIISAVLRNTGGGAFGRYIQTDASINRGNSGGPLFDMQGNVIGINNAIISPSGGSVGIGFAIPSEIAQPIVTQLIDGEPIKRGYLGIQIMPINDDLADSLGIDKNRGEFVQSVLPDGAAAKAGLEEGDIILSLDGKDVTPDQTLSFLIANIEPGSRIPMRVLRQGKEMTVRVTVDTRPSEEELTNSFANPDDEDEDGFTNPSTDGDQEYVAEKLGLSVTPLTPVIRRQLGVAEDTEGLVIAAADANADAGRKGLRRGDIILSANYRPVTSTATLEEIVRSAEAEEREAVLLRVQRRGQPARYVPVRLRD